MDSRASKAGRTLLLIAIACVVPHLCAAQAVPAGSRAPDPSTVDIYVSYGYLHPSNSDIYGQQYDPIPGGVIAGFTGYFNRSFGIDGEYAKFPDNPDYCFSTIQAGPAFRHSFGRLVPFAHAIGGAAQMGPSYSHGGASDPCRWGWGVSGGIGIDYILPALHNRLAIRPIEGDFQFVDVNFGQQIPPNSFTGGVGQLFATRISAGLVLRLGETTPPLPAAFGCQVQPVTVYPGDPISVTGSVINMEQSKKLLPVYTWNATGGRLTRSAEGATIATAGLAAGDYNITGQVSEGSRPDQHAECTASFRVVAYEPPTIACSASPTSIMTGGSSTITTVARSPQNRALTLSYGTTAGQITGTGATATLATADVRAGTINVTCNVVDDLGKSASATTTISVAAPPPPPVPPAPVARSLCSVSFERDKKHPVRVDNEAKGCLDDIALELNRDTAAVLMVVGKHDPKETPDAAAERTLNVKQYLTDQKGIDPSRIEVRTGEVTGRTADDVLVPAGATWDSGTTTSFNPTQIKRHGQPYAPAPR